jgi:hypothetical protein
MRPTLRRDAFWPPARRSPTRHRARMRSHASPHRTVSPGAHPGIFRRCSCFSIAPGSLVDPRLTNPTGQLRRLGAPAGRRYVCLASSRLCVERTSGCIGDCALITSLCLIRPVASMPPLSCNFCSRLLSVSEEQSQCATWSVSRTRGHRSFSTQWSGLAAQLSVARDVSVPACGEDLSVALAIQGSCSL